jgi:hypothetical protein
MIIQTHYIHRDKIQKKRRGGGGAIARSVQLKNHSRARIKQGRKEQLSLPLQQFSQQSYRPKMTYMRTKIKMGEEREVLHSLSCIGSHQTAGSSATAGRAING